MLGHVQDENGQKMSKSKGNAVDPFEALETYGADASPEPFTAASYIPVAHLVHKLLQSARRLGNPVIFKVI